jgi:hypothetical protein
MLKKIFSRPMIKDLFVQYSVFIIKPAEAKIFKNISHQDRIMKKYDQSIFL